MATTDNKPKTNAQRWKRPKRFDRNLIVIGAGSAGLVSAYIAAGAKAKVTLVEANRMGGDCLNFGCVPSKALIGSAKAAHRMRHADRYGLRPVEPNIPFSAVMERVHKVIAEIEPHDSIERYTALGVEVLKGYAKLIDPWTVEIALSSGETQRLTTRAIVIATGAQPSCRRSPALRMSVFSPQTRSGMDCAIAPRRQSGWSCWAAGRSAANWRKVLHGSGQRSHRSKWLRA